MTELMQEHSKLFTCPNKSCRKTFSKPLRTLNLHASSVVYDACPYCLSNMPSPKSEYRTSADGMSGVPSKSAACHHLGFLAERSEKGLVPDECLLCKEIISCMTTTSNSK